MGTLVLNGATSGSTTLSPVDAVTATITLPSATATVATLAGTETLSNKTITATGNISTSGTAVISSGNSVESTGPIQLHAASKTAVSQEISGSCITAYGPNTSTRGVLKLRAALSSGGTSDRLTIDASGNATFAANLSSSGNTVQQGGTDAGAHDDSSFNVAIQSLSSMGLSRVTILSSPFAGGPNSDLVEIYVCSDHDGTQRAVYTRVNGVVAGSASTFTVPNAGYTATWSLTLSSGSMNVYISATPMVAYIKYFIEILQ
jgi:hypothetical protein